ncbi:hypothetical protein EH183_37390 [Streptomyces sp. CB01881]|nr:hypothetical protein C2142_37370 [Streptomyces sp. CB01881]TYC69818.1 hypothetical protein EH183_37390 [Streptomyces sp. CB01881]
MLLLEVVQQGERQGEAVVGLDEHQRQQADGGPELTADTWEVRTRTAPAGSALGLRTVHRWTADADLLRLTITVAPEGDWTIPLPRLGVRMGLPVAFGRARWFGGGPGEGAASARTSRRRSSPRCSIR